MACLNWDGGDAKTFIAVLMARFVFRTFGRESESSFKLTIGIRYIPIKEIVALYSPYHEMDIHHFVDKMNDFYKTAKPETNLKLLRKKAGFNQKTLAELSSVPLRTIQQYEQRQKSINKAQAIYLVMLAQALCCKVEDLLEKVE